jgi:hypothetical protein
MKPAPLNVPGRRVIMYGATQQEYETLPAVVMDEERGTVLTRWELTLEERAALLDGACVLLWITTMQKPLQPVAIEVEGLDEKGQRREKGNGHGRL